MQNNILIFDCETTSLPADERALFRPDFEAPANYSDPAKIEAIKAKKEAEWAERAALSALTGKILCIGCWTQAKGFFVLESDNESDVIQSALDLLQGKIQIGGKVVGFNCLAFDLPFLCQRAWRLGLYVPKCLKNGKWWAEEILDLMTIWHYDRISLDHLAKALGVGAKNGDGAQFGELWATDKPKALEYVRNDVELIRLCANRMLSL